MSASNSETISFAQILEETCQQANLDPGVVLIGEAIKSAKCTAEPARVEITWETELEDQEAQDLSGFVKDGIVKAFQVKAVEPVIGHLAFRLTDEITAQRMVNTINHSKRVFVPFMETGISTKIR